MNESNLHEHLCAVEPSKETKDVLAVNLSKTKKESFNKFLNQTPKGLKGSGIENRLLVLGLQIELAKNLLDEEEMLKFNEIINKIHNIQEMNKSEITTATLSHFCNSKRQEILIPDFDKHPNVSMKLQGKFIDKLRSLGFDISKGSEGHTDPKKYYLKLSFLEEYDDAYFKE